MKLADKILDLRKQSGLSQEELAEKLDVSRQAVSRWEVGSALPDAANVLQLSKLFGVTADYLLNDDYESDRDVPAIKNTEFMAHKTIKRFMAIGLSSAISALGLFANALIYVLSRFIEVPIPYIYYENGTTMQKFPGYMGHSYRYFIENFSLELIVVLSWVLFFAGLIYIFLSSEKVKNIAAKFRKSHRHIKHKTDEKQQ